MSIGLIRTLYQHKLIDNDQVEHYREIISSGKTARPFLFEDGVISASNLAQLLSTTFNLPLFDLRYYGNQINTHGIKVESLQKGRCIPLVRRANHLFLAVSDPSTIQEYQDIASSIECSLDLVIVNDERLGFLLESVSQQSTSIFDEISNSFSTQDVSSNTMSASNDEGEDGPVARFIFKMLADGIKAGASDIHFEFYEDNARVRFRVDGVMRSIVNMPNNIKSLVASRIKVMARLDIAEKRIPQDGRIQVKFNANQKAIDFRVSTLPTVFGEKIVMRILNSDAAMLNINQLGFEAEQKKMILDAIARPYGMVLVTGPTGSGKTVTLYTCLNILNTDAVNISTVEDPAEINLAGINQVSVNEKQGLTFSVALRAFLRQDPDVIMVGEIRDLETADIAIKAAQTGHMVFSTLHTNNAPATLSRLLNMGVPPFNIASSVNLIVAQRLMRCLCNNCKQETEKPTDDALIKIGFTQEDLSQDWKLYRAVGCERCRGKGYRGRSGIYEIMPISEGMQRIIVNNGTAVDINEQAHKEGLVNLRRAGLLKVMSGISSLEEVLSITNDS